MNTTDDGPFIALLIVTIVITVMGVLGVGLLARNLQDANWRLAQERQDRAWCETRLGICAATCGPPSAWPP